MSMDADAQGLGAKAAALAARVQVAALAVVQPELGPVSSAPTVTLSSSAMTGAQAFNGWNSGAPNPVFGVYGAALLAQRAFANPQSFIISGAPSNSDTSSPTEMTVVFYHYGSQLDIIQYGAAESVYLWVDDVYVGHYAPALATGTAQAGGTNTITLASGASSTNGNYNTCYARVTSGPGSGQTDQITGYVGSTRAATVATNWGTAPDGTSTYSVEESGVGLALDGLTGSIKYLNLAWTTTDVRKITVVQGAWRGVNIGPNDAIWAGPPVGATRLLVLGDSFWDNTGLPRADATMTHLIGRHLGMQVYNLSQGGTGWTNRNAALNRLTFLQRIAPPTEAWRLQRTDTGTASGTFTLSVTFGGSTQTTSALAFNASAATVETALNALSNVPASSINVARGDLGSPWIILAASMSGATLSFDGTGLTNATLAKTAYLGDVAPAVPLDGNGNALPFVLLVPGSGNDSGASDATVQAAVTSAAQAIASRWPTAIPIFTGLVTVQDGGGSGVISATDISRNAAIAAGAAALPKINAQTAFIDTFENGLGGNAWVTGSSTVASPTTNKTDVLKSVLVAGHPTGAGHVYLAARMAVRIKSLFRAS